MAEEKFSIEKIGKEWQSMGYANGWSERGIEWKIVEEVRRRGGKFEDVGTIRGDHTCTCEEFKVSYKYDSSD